MSIYQEPMVRGSACSGCYVGGLDVIQRRHGPGANLVVAKALQLMEVIVEGATPSVSVHSLDVNTVFDKR